MITVYNVRRREILRKIIHCFLIKKWAEVKNNQFFLSILHYSDFQ